MREINEDIKKGMKKDTKGRHEEIKIARETGKCRDIIRLIMKYTKRETQKEAKERH